MVENDDEFWGIDIYASIERIIYQLLENNEQISADLLKSSISVQKSIIPAISFAELIKRMLEQNQSRNYVNQEIFDKLKNEILDVIIKLANNDINNVDDNSRPYNGHIIEHKRASNILHFWYQYGIQQQVKEYVKKVSAEDKNLLKILDKIKHTTKSSVGYGQVKIRYKIYAYMSWLLSHKYGGDFVSERLGDMHENETPNAPAYERNMDLWNNAIGREIAYEMKKNLGDNYELLNDDWASDIASQKIWEKMQQGELITNPFTDRRKFENMELERLTENDRIYSDGEFRNFDEKVKALYHEKYMDYVINNHWEIPSVENLDKRVQSGELIYVDNYTRSDGTKVNGYYRRRPYYTRKK